MSIAAQTWLLVAVAGAAGTLLRYALGGWVSSAAGTAFPWGTFAINVLGSCAIGVVAGLVEKGAFLSPPMRLAIMVGFLGGFTTFSTFALEAFRLAAGGQWPVSLAYLLLTNVLGFAAVWAGYRAALLC